MPKDMSANKAGENIMRTGHTAVKEFGSDPNMKGRYAGKAPRDLKP